MHDAGQESYLLEKKIYIGVFKEEIIYSMESSLKNYNGVLLREKLFILRKYCYFFFH